MRIFRKKLSQERMLQWTCSSSRRQLQAYAGSKQKRFAAVAFGEGCGPALLSPSMQHSFAHLPPPGQPDRDTATIVSFSCQPFSSFRLERLRIKKPPKHL